MERKFPKRLNTKMIKNYHMIQQVYAQVYNKRNGKQELKQILVYQCSLQYCSQQPKGRNNSSVHEQIDEWINKV